MVATHPGVPLGASAASLLVTSAKSRHQFLMLEDVFRSFITGTYLCKMHPSILV